MRKRLAGLTIVLCAMLLLVGCSSTKIALRIVSPEPLKDVPTAFEDDKIYLAVTPGTNWVGNLEGVNFALKNKTDFSMKIIWDEVTFVDQYNSSARVIHNGVKYIDRDQSMPPSIIPAHSNLNDCVYPSNKVFFNSYSNTWAHQYVVANTVEYNKSRIRILLPIEWNSQRLEYDIVIETLIYESPTT